MGFCVDVDIGRAGVPMEVMGLMLGEFVDEYTVRVVDVFAMPQSGTGVSVEAVDHVFQTNMIDMLKQTGRYYFSFSCQFDLDEIVWLFLDIFFLLLFGVAGRRWLWGGTIHILDLAVGFPVLI